MNKVKILLYEENYDQAKKLKNQIELFGWKVIHIAKNLKQGLTAYHDKIFDVVLINMIECNSSGSIFGKTIYKTESYSKPIIYLIDYEQENMLISKSREPDSFLINPLKEKSIKIAIQQAFQNFEQRIDISKIKFNPNKTFLFKKNNILYQIKPEEINFIEVSGRYSKIFACNQTFHIENSLKEFQKQLPRDTFKRTHRSFIVNTSKVKEVHYNDNLIILENNKKVQLGRSYKNDFIEGYQIFS